MLAVSVFCRTFASYVTHTPVFVNDRAMTYENFKKPN